MWLSNSVVSVPARYAKGLWVESWLGHVSFSSPVTDNWCISMGPYSGYEQGTVSSVLSGF